MNRCTILLSSWLMLVALTGCTDSHDGHVGRSLQDIELAEAAGIFALSSQLLAQRTSDARQRELASLATGALLVPYVDEDRTPATASNGTTLRASCGVTFVSPSFAVTAGHCVDGMRMDTNHLTVKMFRPTLQLAERFGIAATLEGSYPNYTHDRLSTRDGYLVDEFDCSMVARCSADFGGWASCDSIRDTQLAADVALVHCNGAPASRYETLAIASSDDALAEVFLPWKHEIYDVPADPEDDRFQHYARKYDDPSLNYHYFDRNADGEEQNQLLPLISIPFADGTAHHKVTTAELGVTTDLYGCHGTSGSGVLQPTREGKFELLGPIVRGNHELDGYLCNHFPSYDGFSRNPGSQGLTYGSLDATRAMLAEHETELRSDCSSFGDAITARFAPHPCGLLAWPNAEASLAMAPLPLSAQPQTVDANHPLLLDSVALRAGARYRIGLWGSCSGECSSITVTLDGREVISSNAAAPRTEPLVFGASLVATAPQSGPIALRTSGNGTWSVSTLSIVEEGKVLGFDASIERADVLLVDTQPPNPVSSPLRLEGDPGSGFAARIEARERLVLTRQALLPQQATTLRFRTGANVTLFCGILSPTGTTLSRLDCSNGFVRFKPEANAAALFIESGADSSAVNIDDAQVVSGAMPDSDGDLIPDVVDDCPRGPLPPQGELAWSNAGPDLVEGCLPLAQMVALTPPVLTNTCEPATLVGSVSAVHGKALTKGALPLTTTAELLLPNGTVTATYDVLDQRGHVVATLDKRTHVLFQPTSACCSDSQRSVWGNSADELFDYSALEQLCAFTGNGQDFVVSGSGTNYVAAGADSDYLSAAGEQDTLLGGDGNDCINVTSTRAVVVGGAGDDTLHGWGAAATELYGGPGRDVIVASSGPDVIVPGSGGDWVDAGAGDDLVIIYEACEVTSGLRLYGGEGSDVLRSPMSEAALRDAGVVIDGFEAVVLDDSLGYLSDCFGEGLSQ